VFISFTLSQIGMVRHCPLPGHAYSR
jgi:hypothetical protein